MASYSAARAAIKTNLEAVTGLRSYADAVGDPNVPAAIVLPGSPPITFNESRDSHRYNFDVLVLVQLADSKVAQNKLDGYLEDTGELSVKAAVEANERLGGIAGWTTVTGVTQYGDVEYAGRTYLGARLLVEVSIDAAY